MNRILLTLFTFVLLSAIALGQERTKPELRRPEQVYTPDTAGIREEPGVIIRDRDSLSVLRQDSLTVLRQDSLVPGDTLYTEWDTLYAEPDFSHSPSRALMFALVLPGLGQAYNNKYWKIPIVWLALGGAGYAISYNTRQYRLWSQEYANDPENTDERYLQIWRRYMELSYIAAIGVYALQVLDAYVDAQLYSWDVNDNLSMGVSPSLQPLMSPSGLTGQAYGLTCTFKLK